MKEKGNEVGKKAGKEASRQESLYVRLSGGECQGRFIAKTRRENKAYAPYFVLQEIPA